MSKSGEKKVSHVIGKRSDTMHSLIIEAVKVQRGVDKKVSTVSNSLLDVAKAYQERKTIGNVNESNSDKFLAGCDTEETFIKSKEAGHQQVDKLPRCWTQAKSNIKAAINYGIDLKDYTSESALRKAVAKVRAGLAGKDPFNETMKALKKDLEALPPAKALIILQDVVLEVHEAIKEALAEVLPVEPAKPKLIGDMADEIAALEKEVV